MQSVRWRTYRNILKTFFLRTKITKMTTPIKALYKFMITYAQKGISRYSTLISSSNHDVPINVESLKIMLNLKKKKYVKKMYICTFTLFYFIFLYVHKIIYITYVCVRCVCVKCFDKHLKRRIDRFPPLTKFSASWWIYIQHWILFPDLE